MKNLIYGLILVLAGATLCLPETANGQNKKTSAQTNPPKLIKYIKPVRKKILNSANADSKVKSKRKKTRMRRIVDLTKVPRLIRPAN
jgi:hypothetical protein